MPRDPRAYLKDVIEACDAIVSAVGGLDLAQYRSNRLVRSAVKREFILIGEAITGLRRHAPTAFGRITDGARIVDFRNQLTHEYVHVNDVVVWGIIEHNVATLRRECTALLSEMKRAAEGS
jgi:uncharacterized protein with HEPN domain